MSLSGFCVGYRPQSFSSGPGGPIRQTVFMGGPPAILHMSPSLNRWTLRSSRAAQMSVSVEWVKYRLERFGGGSGFSQAIMFSTFMPSCLMAKPTEKMLWCVPVTQIVPFGRSKSRHRPSHPRFQAWSASKPEERSHGPLSTDTTLPDWQEIPPFERKYGGSAKMQSKRPSGY